MTPNCVRCGSEVDLSEWWEFKCSQCENIRIKREDLEPIVQKVKDNYMKAKNSNYGFALRNLYLFGSYLKGLAECCDIDEKPRWMPP